MSRFWQGAAAGAIATAAAAAATLAWSHGGDTNAVHACVTSEGQAILLSSANGTCGAGPSGQPANALDWAIQGPKGETGAQGPKGEQGDTGPKGEKGDAGDAASAPVPAYFVKTAAKTLTGGLNVVEVKCPKGSQVLNGGYSVPFGFGSFPIDGVSHEGVVRTFSVVPWQIVGEGASTANGWLVELYAFDTGDGKFGSKRGTKLTVRALCVLHKLDVNLGL